MAQKVCAGNNKFHIIRFLGFAMKNNLANVLKFLNNKKFFPIISTQSYKPVVISAIFR